MSTLKCLTKKKKVSFEADRSEGKGGYQNYPDDLLFPGSRVVLGMNLLTLMYFCNNLSSLATCHISEFFVLFLLFATLYKNRRVRFWMSILPWVKPFVSPTIVVLDIPNHPWIKYLLDSSKDHKICCIEDI